MAPSSFLPVALLTSLPLWSTLPGVGMDRPSVASQDHDVQASPFDGIRWSEGLPEVQVEGPWYAPVAIDGIAVEEILAYCDRRWPGQREKRFSEDLVEALVALGWEGDLEVDLALRSVADGSSVRLRTVAMTKAKRNALRDSARVNRPRRPSAPSRISVEEARADIDAFGAGLKDQFAYLGLGEVDLDRELNLILDNLPGDGIDVSKLRF